MFLWQLAQDLMLFDHQGPVSNVGPLGSQHSHHTALRGNKVCLCEYIHMKKSVSYVDVHLCLHLFPCDQHACVLASFVDPQKWQQFSMAVEALWYSASITRPQRPLTAHLSLFT